MVPAETKATKDIETTVKELLRKCIAFISNRSQVSECNPVLDLQTMPPLSPPTARFVKKW